MIQRRPGVRGDCAALTMAYRAETPSDIPPGLNAGTVQERTDAAIQPTTRHQTRRISPLANGFTQPIALSSNSKVRCTHDRRQPPHRIPADTGRED